MRGLRLGFIALGLAAVCLQAAPAQADWWQWHHGWRWHHHWWRRPVIVVPLPVYYAPPPVYYAPPPVYYPPPTAYYAPGVTFGLTIR